MALALVCAGLVIFLIVMKSGDNAQHESDAGAVADFSNRLDSAQTQIAFCNGTMFTLSNRLDESRSASVTFSNRLIEVESVIALDAEQITNLNRQVAEMKLENQTLNQRFMDLTNQMTSQIATLTKQISVTEASLKQANTNYTLLENRLRRDVAERLVIQRKFYNRAELQAQLDRLKNDPFTPEISAQSIYAGLDVEVQSNSLHVLSQN